VKGQTTWPIHARWTGTTILYIGGCDPSAKTPVDDAAPRRTLGGKAWMIRTKSSMTSEPTSTPRSVGGSHGRPRSAWQWIRRGHIYVAARTNSTNLPVTKGSVKADVGGGQEDSLVVMKYAANGSLARANL